MAQNHMKTLIGTNGKLWNSKSPSCVRNTSTQAVSASEGER